MIGVSAVLVVLAAVLLVIGLAAVSGPYLYASIVTSAIAALTLVAGVRRRSTGGPLLDDDFDVPVRPPNDHGAGVTRMR